MVVAPWLLCGAESEIFPQQDEDISSLAGGEEGREEAGGASGDLCSVSVCVIDPLPSAW